MSLKKESYQLTLAAELLRVNLNPSHELVILANQIDWDTLTYKLQKFFKKTGRNAKRIRLMVGLLFLKHLYNLSDRTVASMVNENIYFKYFCGLHYQVAEWSKDKPLDASTITKFRRRLGKEGMQVIEDMIKTQLYQEGRISRKTQLVDTTAQEKNIAYPTDSNLLARGIRHVKKKIDQLKAKGLSVHARSFSRLIRKEVLKINKLGRGRKERIAEGIKNLVQYAKKMLKAADSAQKAIKKKTDAIQQTTIDVIKEQLKKEAELVGKVIKQAQARLNGEKIEAKEKVFSMHEPDSTVIAKGKRGKRYEFGAKVNLSADRNHFIVGHQEYNENIADVKALDPAIEDWEKTFGDVPDELGGDRGFHTKNLSDKVSRIKRLAIQTKGKNPHPDHKKSYFKRIQRKRNTLEAVIGHLKTDHRMNRCRYAGSLGDTLNVSLAVTAWNLRKWARQLIKEQAMAAEN
jgi:IS5 family transposase